MGLKVIVTGIISKIIEEKVVGMTILYYVM